VTADALIEPVILRGVAAPGLGKATQFTSLPWVARAFADKLGFAVWPGTFNVRLADDGSVQLWAAVVGRVGIEIEPPDSATCVAVCYRTWVNGSVSGAIVLPHVAGYPSDQVEVVADRSIRSALALNDGDPVALHLVGLFEPSLP